MAVRNNPKETMTRQPLIRLAMPGKPRPESTEWKTGGQLMVAARAAGKATKKTRSPR
jgi:hypothetical protein